MGGLSPSLHLKLKTKISIMAFKNVFIDSDLPCVSVENLSPEVATATVATDFTVDIPIQGGTITSVEITPGDGQAAIAMANTTGDEYEATITYPSAGSYTATVSVVDSAGNTQNFQVGPIVVS